MNGGFQPLVGTFDKAGRQRFERGLFTDTKDGRKRNL
jgi:hypothetical protein